METKGKKKVGETHGESRDGNSDDDKFNTWTCTSLDLIEGPIERIFRIDDPEDIPFKSTTTFEILRDRSLFTMDRK